MIVVYALFRDTHVTKTVYQTQRGWIDVALTAAYARYEGTSIGPQANAQRASRLIMQVRPVGWSYSRSKDW